MVGDGLIGFTVESTDPSKSEVYTIVENDGMLGETKSVNLPNICVDLPAITKKDIDDILFGVEQKVDFIAASFIRKPTDVLEIRELIKGSNIKIDNFDEILKVSDGIMVARGDLGVEVPVEKGIKEYHFQNLGFLNKRLITSYSSKNYSCSVSKNDDSKV